MPQHKSTLLTFPCSFPLKVIGKDEDDFEFFVLAIVSKHVLQFSEDAVESKPSGGGKYRSVTVTFIAESQIQIDSLYRELSAHERVIMVM